jgi:hypothetical protein
VIPGGKSHGDILKFCATTEPLVFMYLGNLGEGCRVAQVVEHPPSKCETQGKLDENGYSKGWGEDKRALRFRTEGFGG